MAGARPSGSRAWHRSMKKQKKNQSGKNESWRPPRAGGMYSARRTKNNSWEKKRAHYKKILEEFERFGWRDWTARPWLWLPPKLAHDLSPHLLKIYSRYHAAKLKAAEKWRGWMYSQAKPLIKSRWDLGGFRPGPYQWGGFFWRNLYFPNRLGPAGGLDKSGLNVREWWALGAGFCEIGTITPIPQSPNKGKILSRSLRRQALWNHMGFPNRGLDFARRQLEKLPPPQFYSFSFKEGRRAAENSAPREKPARRAISEADPFDSAARIRLAPVFVNIGKNRETPLERAEEDYHKSLRSLCHLADAFVINISSPNTEGLRGLFGAKRLPSFLNSLKKALEEAVRSSPPAAGLKPPSSQAARPCPPLILKLSPDGEEGDFFRLIDQTLEAGIDGFCLGNSSKGLKGAPADFPQYGGVSGKPLARRSLFLLKALRKHLRRQGSSADGKLIISCGGVCSPADVFERLEEGADLTQVYSALALKGPVFLRDVKNLGFIFES